MTSAAQTTLRLLRQLEKQDAEHRDRDPGGQPDAVANSLTVSAAEMLEALIEHDFDLNAAIVGLRRDA